MSIVRMCPYDKDEHCKYEIYFGEPMFSKCGNCEIKIGAVIKQRKMKEELKQEAEKWLRKFLLCNDCKRKCHCIELNAYCEEQVLKAYIDSAESREKRIAEFEAQIEKMQDDIDCLTFACENYREEMEKNLANATELEKENAELRKELKEWKDEWQEQVQKANDEGYTRTLQTIQLTKAKELLKKVVTDFHNMDCVTVHIDKTIAEAEQFLKDSEVEK